MASTVSAVYWVSYIKCYALFCPKLSEMISTYVKICEWASIISPSTWAGRLQWYIICHARPFSSCGEHGSVAMRLSWAWNCRTTPWLPVIEVCIVPYHQRSLRLANLRMYSGMACRRYSPRLKSGDRRHPDGHFFYHNFKTSSFTQWKYFSDDFDNAMTSPSFTL